jgi:hypothetical protein
VPNLEKQFGMLSPLRKQVTEALEHHGEKQHLVVMDNNILSIAGIEDIIAEIRDLGFAAAKAKTGAEIVDLTYLLNYEDDYASQWQGYTHTYVCGERQFAATKRSATSGPSGRRDVLRPVKSRSVWGGDQDYSVKSLLAWFYAVVKGGFRA